MGQERACRVTLDGTTRPARAWLEHDRIIVRGEVRVSVPFTGIREMTVSDGALLLTFGARTARLELGALAEKWARAIREPKSLLDKLGVKPGQRVAALRLADPAFIDLLRARGGEIRESRPRKGTDVIFLGASTAADLARLETLKAFLSPAGAIWVVRPKGRKEITEAQVMAAGRRVGLVDVKVVSFSPTHTAEKFVIPLQDRT